MEYLPKESSSSKLKKLSSSLKEESDLFWCRFCVEEDEYSLRREERRSFPLIRTQILD